MMFHNDGIPSSPFLRILSLNNTQVSKFSFVYGSFTLQHGQTNFFNGFWIFYMDNCVMCKERQFFLPLSSEWLLFLVTALAGTLLCLEESPVPH